MKLPPLLAAVTAVALGLVGIASCSGVDAAPRATDGGTVSPAGPSHLPCDVDQVLEANCRQCHGAEQKFGAPMPLVTWDDLQAPARTRSSVKVFEQVGVRIPRRREADAPAAEPAPRRGVDEDARRVHRRRSSAVG
jgi:mono/diheme cytochrome c family protein